MICFHYEMCVGGVVVLITRVSWSAQLLSMGAGGVGKGIAEAWNGTAGYGGGDLQALRVN